MNTKILVTENPILDALVGLLICATGEAGCQKRKSRPANAANTRSCGCRHKWEPLFADKPTPKRGWEIRGKRSEDKDKVFGVNVRVDEPRRCDYASRWEFERDHSKFDRLVDAAKDCTWENKCNTAPVTKVNAVRRRVEEGPVFGLDLVGETDWW